MIKIQPTDLVMVTYFRPNDMLKCVASILSNTHSPFRLSIIDNSHGGIDNALSTINDERVTIYKNSINLGKGRAFMKWYHKIVGGNDHFVSIDADMLVPPNWLTKMKDAADVVKATGGLGVLAPTIVNELGDTFHDQMKRGKLVMHASSPQSGFLCSNIYRNRHTAGSLFYIDKQFFDGVGGFAQNQLYGNDDGELCKSAHKSGRFIGIVTDVEVLHLRADSDRGYVEWKKNNIKGDVDGVGYWD